MTPGMFLIAAWYEIAPVSTKNASCERVRSFSSLRRMAMQRRLSKLLMLDWEISLPIAYHLSLHSYCVTGERMVNLYPKVLIILDFCPLLLCSGALPISPLLYQQQRTTNEDNDILRQFFRHTYNACEGSGIV